MRRVALALLLLATLAADADARGRGRSRRAAGRGGLPAASYDSGGVCPPTCPDPADEVAFSPDGTNEYLTGDTAWPLAAHQRQTIVALMRQPAASATAEAFWSKYESTGKTGFFRTQASGGDVNGASAPPDNATPTRRLTYTTLPGTGTLFTCEIYDLSIATAVSKIRIRRAETTDTTTTLLTATAVNSGPGTTIRTNAIPFCLGCLNGSSPANYASVEYATVFVVDGAFTQADCEALLTGAEPRLHDYRLHARRDEFIHGWSFEEAGDSTDSAGACLIHDFIGAMHLTCHNTESGDLIAWVE